MAEVAAVKTPIDPANFLEALRTAWEQQLGSSPTNQSLALLYGQVALETANLKSCVCYNWGNAKYRGTGDYCSFSTWEHLGGKDVPMVCKFQAFPDAVSGLNDYLSHQYTRWDKAWPFVVTGDVVGYVTALRAMGYFTAPLADYIAGVRRWQAWALALLGGASAPAEPDCSDIPSAFRLGLAGL